MAYSVIFTRSADGNNYDMRCGTSKSFTFTRTSGSLPPNSATITDVTVKFSNIIVYVGRDLDPRISFGTLGTFPLNLAESGGEQSGSLTNISASAVKAFSGGSLTLTSNADRTEGSTCANIRSTCAITITVTYEVSTTSTGTLSSSSVMQGSNISMTINPADVIFTHKITWADSGGHSSTVDVGFQTVSIFPVPSNWSTGSATAVLYTYNGTTLVGSRTYTFVITIDGSNVYPSIGQLTVALSQSQYIPSGWGVFVKGYSRANLSVNNATAGSQASFSNITLICGTQRQSTQNTKVFLTDPLAETGVLTCDASVTNNFSNTDVAVEQTITVYDYFDPQIGKLSAYRCASAIDSTPDETGHYIAVSLQVTFADVNNHNSLVSLTAQWKKTNETTWSAGVAITNGGVTIIGNGTILGEDTYEVRVTAVDQVQNLRGSYSQQDITALIADSIIHILNGGLNVSFGKEGSRQNAIEINEDWDIYHGDTKLNNTVPVSRGGTGATTEAGARTNLGITPANIGAAESGHSHNLGDLGGTLGVSKGGTGATTADGARSAIGAAAASHSHGASDITSGTMAWARLPFKIQYGKTDITASWKRVNFSSGFFSDSPAVVCTYTDDAATSGINVIKTKDITNSYFDVCTAGNNTTSRNINWVAIGT